MKSLKKISFVFLIISLMACASEEHITPVDLSLTDTPLVTAIPSRTPFPTLPMQPPTWTALPTKTITPTLNPTQQIWLSTAIAIDETQQAIDQQTREKMISEIEKFSFTCNDSANYFSEFLSPDGKWIAVSCGYDGYKISQTLIVQNKEGINWILEFEDFLGPVEKGGPGALIPVFWDIDGGYLYFSVGLGVSGGGDDCFPGLGNYGLFRLNLNIGSWITLIPTRDIPYDFELDFSSSGRRYSTDIDGVMITDIKTGEVIQIKTSGVIELIWSPDGINLAYSVASCNKEGNVVSSSVYIWNAISNEVQEVFKTENEGILLRPEAWDNNSTLRTIGEKLIDLNYLYTVYLYDITQEAIILSGTATPQP